MIVEFYETDENLVSIAKYIFMQQIKKSHSI